MKHEFDSDAVNPAHYKTGRTEAIEVIVDTVQHAPDPVDAFLQGNTLKYLLRLWHKGNPAQDAAKAHWYLERLIQRLEGLGVGS